MRTAETTKKRKAIETVGDVRYKFRSIKSDGVGALHLTHQRKFYAAFFSQNCGNSAKPRYRINRGIMSIHASRVFTFNYPEILYDRKSNFRELIISTTSFYLKLWVYFSVAG